MGKLIVLFAFLLSALLVNTSWAQHSHSEEDLSENEVLLILFERDLAKDFEKAHQLYNTILSDNVNIGQKCAYNATLAEVISILDITIKQYMMRLANSPASQFSDTEFGHPNGVSVRQVKAYQMLDRSRSLEASSEIFAKKYNCN